MPLKLKELKILHQLDLNARAPAAEIARATRLSKESVLYRIASLERAGIIRYHYAIIDWSKLGYDMYRIGLKLQRTTPERETEIVEWLKPRVGWIVSTFGRYDLWMVLYAKSNLEFMAFMAELLERYSRHLEDRWISIVTRLWNYRRAYLLKRPDTTRPDLIEATREPIELDSLDLAILRALATSARTPNVELARRLHTSEKTIRYRIRALMDKGIILSFRPFIDIYKLGYNYFKLFFTLYSNTAEDLRRLRGFAHLHPNILYCTEALGGRDFELEAHIESTAQLYALIAEIKSRFPIIRSYEVMQFIKEHKVSYLPEI